MDHKANISRKLYASIYRHNVQEIRRKAKIVEKFDGGDQTYRF